MSTIMLSDNANSVTNTIKQARKIPIANIGIGIRMAKAIIQNINTIQPIILYTELISLKLGYFISGFID